MIQLKQYYDINAMHIMYYCSKIHSRTTSHPTSTMYIIRCAAITERKHKIWLMLLPSNILSYIYYTERTLFMFIYVFFNHFLDTHCFERECFNNWFLYLKCVMCY